MKQKILLRKKAKAFTSLIQIGKNGLTNGLINEIKKQLRKKKLIKLKILKSALENKTRKEIANELLEKTGSELIEQVGHVIVITKNDN